jgi:hypothetical protein
MLFSIVWRDAVPDHLAASGSIPVRSTVCCVRVITIILILNSKLQKYYKNQANWCTLCCELKTNRKIHILHSLQRIKLQEHAEHNMIMISLRSWVKHFPIFYTFKKPKGDPSSSVNRVTGYGKGSNARRERNIYLRHHCVQTGSGAYLAS